MYKFYRIPDTDTLLKIIGENASIKFPSAFLLNDPYELKFNLKIDPNSAKQQEDFFRTHPERTTKDYEDWKSQFSDNFVWYVEQVQRNYVAQVITLASFSMKCSNNLMWSHYTDNYRGICVEYADDELLANMKADRKYLAHSKVGYSDTPPLVDTALDTLLVKIQKMIFNKQSDWKYENEFRIIFNSDQDVDYIPVGKGIIKSVIVGTKTSGLITRLIHENAQKYNYQVYYAITVGNGYDVQIEPHKDGTFYTRSFWREL